MDIDDQRLIQNKMKSEFSIYIGEFECPKNDHLYDPVQSYYKQFVSSENALYFFKYESQKDLEVNDLIPHNPAPTKVFQNSYSER